MSDRKQEILDALRTVVDPDLGRDIVSLGFVKNLRVCGKNVAFDLELTTPACPVKEQFKRVCREKILALGGFEEVEVRLTSRHPGQVSSGGGMFQRADLSGVRNVLAVASGKGGVGKSTVAVNLAVSLREQGFRVGLLDADIYGPSIPLMLGLEEEPTLTMRGKLIPVKYGELKVVSAGLLSGEDTPIIWRGPLVTQLTQQFLAQVEWGELDYLVVDLPPGTGDIQITLCQSIPLSGAVIVTTPQDLCCHIARKALRMFERLNVPIVGIVENMSAYICSKCGQTTHIFARGEVEEFAHSWEVPFLGRVPLEGEVVRGEDTGRPVVLEYPESRSAKAFQRIVGQVVYWSTSSREEGGRILLKSIALPTPREIEIKWSDGVVSRFQAYDLRLACTCAACVDEWTGENRLDRESVPRDLEVRSYKEVGNYGIRFEWSDGHHTGIYTYEHLRGLHLAAAES